MNKIYLKLRLYLPVCLFLTITLTGSLNAQVKIVPDRQKGIYNTGETVKWKLYKNDTSNLKSVRYRILEGGLLETASGKVDFRKKHSEISYTFESPGSVLLDVRWGKEDNMLEKATGGALADPEKLLLSAPAPDDFNEFWRSKLEELEKIPMNPQLSAEESGIEGIEYWKITMDNIRGSHIRGQLARPETDGKLPALLIVQWAGVYGLQKNWVTDRAKAGWLVLNINPHDLPIDREPEFYREQAQGALKDYYAIGNDNRETSYFLRMYLSCYRAAEYLRGRSDWDGKTLVVMGDSQGGQQALMTAGFHPGISACLALVPAGFDMLGPKVGRKGGWPQWYDKTEGKNPADVHEASRYFDVANFIPRIKCPVLAGVGLLDETCPPEGILAGLNQLKSPAEIILLPKSGHQDRDGSQKAYKDRKEEVWLPTLRKGEKLPFPAISE